MFKILETIEAGGLTICDILMNYPSYHKEILEVSFFLKKILIMVLDVCTRFGNMGGLYPYSSYCSKPNDTPNAPKTSISYLLYKYIYFKLFL